MDLRSPPGSSVHGILQARTLGWVAMPSSRGSSPPRDRICISYVSCIGSRLLPLALPGKPFFLWRWRQSTSPLPPNSLQRMGALLADAGSRGNGGECGIYEGPGQMPQAWFAWDAWHCALGHGSSCHLLLWSKHAGSQTNLNRLNCILTLPLFMSICYKLHLTLEVHVEWAVTFAS